MPADAKFPWATTAEVCAAAEIVDSTAMKWSARGVLPPYVIISGGRRGRRARWPLHAPAQAAWVKAKLEQGYTFEDIQLALQQGEFTPPEEVMGKPGPVGGTSS